MKYSEARKLIGSLMRQARFTGDLKPMPGSSIVKNVFEDEKGNVHCHMANDWWVPVVLLETVNLPQRIK